MLVRRRSRSAPVVLVLILLVVGIKGCVDSRKERALKDYNRNVARARRRTPTAGRQALFDAARQHRQRAPATSQAQVNQLRVAADGPRQARSARRPRRDEGRPAASSCRRSTLRARRRSARSPTRSATALGTGRAPRPRSNQIAGQMQAFLASDVVYSQRVAPLHQGGARRQRRRPARRSPAAVPARPRLARPATRSADALGAHGAAARARAASPRRARTATA